MVLASWLSKVILGSSLLVAGTGLSVGSVLLVTRNSFSEESSVTKEKHTSNEIEEPENNVEKSEVQGEISDQQIEESGSDQETEELKGENPASTNIEETVVASPKHVTCTIYKVIRSKNSLLIEEAEGDFLNIEARKKTSFHGEIKNACGKANGGDIFVIEKWKWYWSGSRKEWSLSKSNRDNIPFKDYVDKKLKLRK